MSTIASSTSDPSAMTNPARIIVLIVVPRQYSTIMPAISDSGIAMQVMSATRHSIEEQRQHQHDEQTAEQQRPAQMLDRDLDEARRTEDRGIDLQIRQAGLQGRERVIDALGHLERVRPGKLLDDEQQARAAVDDGIADQRLMAPTPSWRRP